MTIASVGLHRLVALIFITGPLVFAFPGVVSAQMVGPDDVVVWTAGASPTDVHGDWIRESDSTAAGGFALRNPDRGRARVSPALASPTNYFDMRFTAKRDTAYHLWVRLRADNDANPNDSVHAQFSDSVDGTGQPITRIGTTGSAEVILQNGPSGETAARWGWADNGWGNAGIPIYFAADGPHIIRIQQREDGAAVDQVVLSPVTFAVSAPGDSRSDSTLLPRISALGPAVWSETSVIHVASAAANRIFGTWQSISDATAAGSQALSNPDAGATGITPALSSPASYFESTFTADAGRPYHVWVRMRAAGNSTANDSVHVQFNDSVTSTLSSTARIGTSDSFEVILQDGSSAPGPSAWGWADNGYGVLGSHVYFASTGTHTIRVQQREDGAVIDQIAISPDAFLTDPPGWPRGDLTIYPTSESSPTNLPPAVALSAPADGATFTAPATITLSATASDPENRLSKVDFYNGSTLLATDTSAPYSFAWSSLPAGSYSLRAVATDADGGSAPSATATVTVTSPSSNQPPSVTLTAPANGATFTAPATMTLSATASDPENRLARVEFYNGSALLNSDSSAPYSFGWSSVAAGTYQLKAVAVDADGGSTSSATASVTVATGATPPPFPNGQQHQDIGAPAIAGSATYSNGTYTVAGAGVNIWDTEDEFHYVYQPMSGDFEIVARIASLQGSNAFSKAGVMVRESLADNARHAFAHVTLQAGYRMSFRTSSGGGSLAQACISGTAPGWVRLIRQGSSFQMHHSTNGTSWTSCATIQVSMASTVYVGLAVGNVDPTGRATAVFDNVRITPTTAGNQPPTVSLTAPANGATFTAPATITLSATASDPENRLSKVDFYNGSTLLATDTSAPYSFAWSSLPAGSYSLRAVATDADGGSASSATATVTVTSPSSNQPPSVTLTAPANGATFTAPATMTLSATASDPENRLARVEFYNGSALLNSDSSAPYSFGWSSVAAGTYQLKAVAVDADGGSTSSATASVTVATGATPPPFPNGQQHQDIGAPAIAGSATYSNGTYTVAGAGVNIWDTEDEFHYVYQPMSGDFEIVARIASLQGSNAFSKAGVMVRESLADDARHAFAHVTLQAGYRMSFRTSSGGGSLAQACISGTAPGWVRLIRQGSSFQMHHSTNGTSWTSCATIQVSMASTVYVGLAVGNVDPTGRATAVFDNVRITPTTAGNQPPTVSLTAPANGATFTAPATITLSATASDPENRLSKVDFYNGSTLLATDTSAPYSFAWSSLPAGSYSLRAVATDADGGSASSAPVTVTVNTTTTRSVGYTASVDHAIMTNYLLEVFPSTANPATATAMTSSDLGKPTPDSNNKIIVDRTTFLNNLTPGNYWITVASVNSAGKSRSAAISFTR